MSQDDQVSDQAARDARAAALVGCSVLRVGYWDVHHFSAEPVTWDYGDWHHAVMGVDLLTDAGPSCVLWTDTFFPYGVEILPTPAADHLVMDEDGPESWDVSGSDPWRTTARLTGSPANSPTSDPRLHMAMSAYPALKVLTVSMPNSSSKSNTA